MIGELGTFTGKRINIFDPKIEDIDSLDIAHHLSMECRWSGACNRHYSVAEHSLNVAYLLSLMFPENHEYPMYGLLHDAHEAYLKDIPTPLKSLFPPIYKEAADKLDLLIHTKFGLSIPTPEQHIQIKLADSYCLRLEAANLFDPPRTHGPDVPPEYSDIDFSFEVNPYDVEQCLLAYLRDHERSAKTA